MAFEIRVHTIGEHLKFLTYPPPPHHHNNPYLLVESETPNNIKKYFSLPEHRTKVLISESLLSYDIVGGGGGVYWKPLICCL